MRKVFPRTPFQKSLSLYCLGRFHITPSSRTALEASVRRVLSPPVILEGATATEGSEAAQRVTISVASNASVAFPKEGKGDRVAVDEDAP